ncbi:MAG: nitroreductase family deazaflavin-dependent oxidoreductase [Anaerolineae bacterium]|nr:nitroreductase family deazaflavin-dependent oxidoreductase [Anaerolineae bacterium]MCI0608197.1 nitroreductase family deazaflavin-dependent oxidoreductase [Anaerolineae bacterium]
MAGLKLLRLTTTGRKTGKERTTPLYYFEHKGKYVIIASAGGADQRPSWFLNLLNNPHVTVRIGNKEIPAVAKIASPVLRRKLWDTLIGMSPMYDRFQSKTKRKIPIILLQPLNQT